MCRRAISCAGWARVWAGRKAIVAVSAHWDTDAPETSAPPANDTIHDFRGFPRALYEIRYPAPSDGLLAREISGLLNGFAARTDTLRGLDHGAWVPLMLMYPEADIPVVQLSVQSGKGAAPSHRAGPDAGAAARRGCAGAGLGRLCP